MIVGTGKNTQVPRSALLEIAASPGGRADQNAIALERTGRDYISYSSISTYLRCPLRYYFVYVARLIPEFVSSSLIFGGAIHRAIELHYNRLMEGTAPPPIDELLAVYEKAWWSGATRSSTTRP